MQTINLCGNWDVFLDEEKKNAVPDGFDYEITLPNTTSNAQIGKLNTEKKYGCLTDRYMFEGYAWFRRTFSLSAQQAERNITLFLERTRKTAVYVDGKEMGGFCSLCAPHRFDLTGLAAGEHEIIIRVDNTDYPTGGGHLTSQDTQTNWNGLTGRIELMCYDAYPETVQVFPDLGGNSVRVRAEIAGSECGTACFTVSRKGKVYGTACADFSADGIADVVIPLCNGFPLWSEFHPELLDLKIGIGGDERTISFGMRELRADGLKLKINGAETFLRGKHDGLVFPKTGFAPTDVDSWIKVFETAKEYGINHYRFHTCCPPEAAFTAADMMGIYMQPELPFWGTVPEEFSAEQEFLRDEGFRMLREYGHHPSFVMMSMGNELWGSKERLEEMLCGYKQFDPDKLFTQGSNNYQFIPCVLPHDDFFSGVRFDRDRLIRGSYGSCDQPYGFIQADEPDSTHNYDSFILPEKAAGGEGGEILIQYGTEMKKVQAEAAEGLIPDVPVISHEVGQYVTYPDFSEIAKYKGSLKHDTYEGYRAAAEEKGLLSHWQDFFSASGKLAVECYRREIEAAMRSENLAGFQLLDLQDFPGQGTATVGILNAFMESKGLVDSAVWRRYCASSTVLAMLPKFIFTSGEKVTAGLAVSSTDPDFSSKEICWRVVCGGNILDEGVCPITKRTGRLSYARNAEFCVECDSPLSAELQVFAGDIINSYTLYVYPEIDVEITQNEVRYGDKRLKIVHSENEAESGVLCIPDAPEGALRGEYSTDFWCYGMFKSISESMGKEIPTGTLGLLIDTESELLCGFPCEKHTTPQWYSVVMHSHCADLSGTGIEPDVWVIDNPQRANRLALLYRKDGMCICTSRLWEIADRIEAKHFAASLVEAILK